MLNTNGNNSLSKGVQDAGNQGKLKGQGGQTQAERLAVDTPETLHPISTGGLVKQRGRDESRKENLMVDYSGISFLIASNFFFSLK